MLPGLSGAIRLYERRILITVVLTCSSRYSRGATHTGGGQDQAHAPENRFLIRAASILLPHSRVSGPFSYIPQRDIGDMEYAALLLDRPAVAQDAAGVLFEPDKIKEPERLIKMENSASVVHIELPDLIARTGWRLQMTGMPYCLPSAVRAAR